MIYEFDSFVLDPVRAELRSGTGQVPLQPQVFDLLLLLVENHDRLVTRDEIVEKVWHDRAISETAISSRVKLLRKSLGDDGSDQRIIRTLHGRGFRCVAEVKIRSAPPPAREAGIFPAAEPDPSGGPPSLAVLPFRLDGDDPRHRASGEALANDMIMGLSRLGWVKVISRGSSFRFRQPDPDPRVVGEALRVRYCLSGMIRLEPGRQVVTIELSQTGDRAVIWAEGFTFGDGNLKDSGPALNDAVLAALVRLIPANEARRARMLPPERQDAWSLYHLGLQHMYRFNRDDTALAADCFRQATACDPEFGRAWSGLSFTDFQNAYLRYSDQADEAIRAARLHAERSVAINPDDPFGYFTLGRSFWLSGDVGESRAWLERSTELSPNFVLGHYAQAWAETMLGHGAAARASVDKAMSLSPLDSFLYAMKGTRALSHIADREPQLAVPWIESAANTPGAHPVVGLVAAGSHALSGDTARARAWVARTLGLNPHVSQAYFFRSVPFADASLRRELAAALTSAGLS